MCTNNIFVACTLFYLHFTLSSILILENQQIAMNLGLEFSTAFGRDIVLPDHTPG